MVSLSVEQGQGGYFFDHQESVPVSGNGVVNHDDLSVEVSSIHDNLVSGPKFHPLHTAWVAVSLIVLFIGYAITAFVLKQGSMDWLGDKFPPFGFFLVLHVLLWLIVFIADRYLQHAHHVSQALGYLQMFRETKEIRRLPYNVLSLGNAILLVIVTVLGHKLKWSGLTLMTILQIIFVLEVVICLPGIIWYLVKVLKFNKAKPQPDAEDNNFFDGYSAPAISQSTETGFRDGEHVDEVLEKQADMIRYLQQHNANLGRRLMQLMQQQQLDARLSGSHETRA